MFAPVVSFFAAFFTMGFGEPGLVDVFGQWGGICNATIFADAIAIRAGAKATGHNHEVTRIAAAR